MAARYTDSEIHELLREPKVLPDDFRRRLKLREKRGHREAEIPILGSGRTEFRLIARHNSFNVLDFSIILAVCPAGSNQLFRLRRHNGKSHEHTNQLERNTFYDFHIHTATQRYQELGTREDGFAEATDRFGDYEGALRCFVVDCAFQAPADQHPNLFGDELI